MGKIMASLTRVLAKMINKPGQPIVGVKVDPPPGWDEYRKAHPNDPQV